jgi:propionate CoA-transferase
MVVKAGTLRARQVKIPGIFVDYVVVAPPEKHRMSKLTYYNSSYCGDIKVVGVLISIEPSEQIS